MISDDVVSRALGDAASIVLETKYIDTNVFLSKYNI